jgi:Flp pilus assembly protein TadG
MTRLKTVSRRRRTSKGNVIVESALIFLVFAVLLLGTFDFGQFLFVNQAIVERARSAARWGAINDPTNHTSIVNMVLYNQSSAPTDPTATYFNLASGNVAVSDPGAGTDNYRLQIRISGYSFTSLSPYIAGNITGPAITVAVPLGAFN